MRYLNVLCIDLYVYKNDIAILIQMSSMQSDTVHYTWRCMIHLITMSKLSMAMSCQWIDCITEEPWQCLLRFHRHTFCEVSWYSSLGTSQLIEWKRYRERKKQQYQQFCIAGSVKWNKHIAEINLCAEF